MNPIIDEKRSQIESLCRTYGVAKLESFGSANTPEFDAETSDFDFVIEFVRQVDGRYGPDIVSRFVKFADELESILGRSVDLVFDSKLKPGFRAHVDSQRELVFESDSHTVAA